jgi:hypothetical protein
LADIPDGGFDGTCDNTVRCLQKEKYHAIKDTCICDCNPADAGFGCAWTGWRWWWFERWLVREFGQQHWLQRLDHRCAGNLDWHIPKFGSERHGSNTCTDAGSVVQLSIELWHAGNRFKRHPHPERHRPDTSAHARSIDFGP